MTARPGRTGARVALALVAMMGAAAPQAMAQSEPQQSQGATEQRGPVTNLPLPRYVSLKGNEGNARRGPSLSHRIDWVFRHAGMPLRVVAEFGHWRRCRRWLRTNSRICSTAARN